MDVEGGTNWVALFLVAVIFGLVMATIVKGG